MLHVDVQHHHLVIREAIRVRSALTMLVFDKSLKLSSQSKSRLGSGRILNMATIDANRILDLFYYGATMFDIRGRKTSMDANTNSLRVRYAM